jgi:plasmid rolling circle replication initiator protein Rep
MILQWINPSVYLSEISPSDKNWDTQRALALFVQITYSQASQYDSYANRMHQCAGMLQFGFRDNPTPDQSAIVLKNALFCRVRYCPVCQWRRSMLWRAKFFQALPMIESTHDGAHWLFLTLTVKNCEITDLRKTLSHMNKSWTRLIKRQSFIKACLGYVRTTEVTYPENGMAHPHYHVMLIVKPSYFSGKTYLSHDAWRELWRESLGINYRPMVNIKRIKGGLTKSILETLKYSTKPTDMLTDPEWFYELTKQTHKMRFVSTGGVLKNILKDDESETDQELITAGDSDETETETNKYRICFGFNRTELRYKHLPHRDIDPDNHHKFSPLAIAQYKKINNSD